MSEPDNPRPRLIWARLLLGLIVLICTEVFSGASLATGLWHPWTWLVTFWLYFCHFFFFTTLAVWTGRTSFWSLYLWGVLFGLYESWITKVIWHGYSGDGNMVLGRLGPYGFGEFSMVVLFHPVMAFLLPLAVACVLSPPLRRWFPDLAWFTGHRRGARALRIYLVPAFGTIVAMNSGGPINLVLNLVVAGILLLVLLHLARPALRTAEGPSLVEFGRRGFAGLCLYLTLLYGVMYALLRPEALPSIPIQAATFVFYALALIGLRLQPRQPPAPVGAGVVVDGESKRVITTAGLVLGLGLLLSGLRGHPALFLPIMVSFVIWTPLGLLLFLLAMLSGFRRRRYASNTPGQSDPSV